MSWNNLKYTKMKKSLLVLSIFLTPLFLLAQNLSDTSLIKFTIKKNGRDLVGLKNSKGKIILTAIYSSIEFVDDKGITSKERSTSSYGVVFNDKNNAMGIIDKEGKLLTPVKYTGIRPFSEGLARVSIIKNDENFYGFINKRGTEVIPPKYNNANNFKNGYAIVSIRDKEYKYKFGYIDSIGFAITAIKYDSDRDFSEGLAAVKLNGKWGFINKAGSEVIQLKYDSVSDFSNGSALVEYQGVKFRINIDGIRVK